MMGSFWLWGWWFFLTSPDCLSCPPFIYMVHFEFEFTMYVPEASIFMEAGAQITIQGLIPYFSLMLLFIHSRHTTLTTLGFLLDPL